jgi:hypothetical protein
MLGAGAAWRGRRSGGAGGKEAGEAQIDRCRPGRAPAGGEGGTQRRGTKNRRMRAGRGLPRLTSAAAPRPGLWRDDEERALEGERALWLDERGSAARAGRTW